ncbi:PAS domain-containing protein [Anaerobacillus sp. HL2]|nr:PAS domain-containing protein [Anaerobacillus sp. HL2]
MMDIKANTFFAHIDILEVLNSINEGCYFLNSRMEFEFINKAAETIIERPKAELLGKCLWDVLENYVGTKLYNVYTQAYQEQKANHLNY